MKLFTSASIRTTNPFVVPQSLLSQADYQALNSRCQVIVARMIIDRTIKNPSQLQHAVDSWDPAVHRCQREWRYTGADLDSAFSFSLFSIFRFLTNIFSRVC